MRFLAALAAVAVVAASAESDVTATPDTLETEGNSDVTVLEDGSEYVVKLGCSGCPFAAKSDNGRVSWPEAPQDNALVCTSYKPIQGWKILTYAASSGRSRHT
jgi:hypothetical protein